MFFSSSILCTLLTTLLVSNVPIALAAPVNDIPRDSVNIAASIPPCNGSPALCSRKYSNVTFIGSHDSAFVGNLPVDNQNLELIDQLNLGVRFLQGQVHEFLGSERFCHTSCIEKAGANVKEYLGEIKGWLDNNPNEVVTLLWTNPDKIDMSKFDTIFKAVGADKYVYTPSGGSVPFDGWPTLGQMIVANTRLVVFIDYGADTSKVPYLLDEFQHFWEDPFDQTDPAFTECKIDRQNNADPDGKNSMFLLNHFLDINSFSLGNTIQILTPNRGAAPTTNSQNSIVNQANICAGLYNKYPNVVLVDFVDKGNPLDAAKALNGV